MKKILVINASANIQDSFSRRLSENFVGNLNSIGYAYDICFRDLADSHIPHISQRWIEADRKLPIERTSEDREELRLSDKLIEELHHADIIVLASPMYNWSVPGSLKAYIDQVMRFNETFTAGSHKDGRPYSGLLENKVLYLLFSRGSQGYDKGERNEQMDFQSPYLQMVFRIMGVEKIYEWAINGTRRNDQELNRELIALQELIVIQLKAEFNNPQ
jgi:FMN-dependent NADH-azoreductase